MKLYKDYTDKLQIFQLYHQEMLVNMNIRRGGYLMMMLDYKGGSGSQESGKKWLRNK